jgi:hypothetical protein
VKSEPIISSFLVYQQPECVLVACSHLLPALLMLYLSNLSWKNRSAKSELSVHRLQVIIAQGAQAKNKFLAVFHFANSSFVFIILALANPQGGKREIDVDGYAGEFVVAVDISQIHVGS